jgi:pterin-4a-carbinolamine dehydratase
MQRLLAMWKQNKHHLVRTFEFNSFSKAVEFINGIALLSIETVHVPFWEEKQHLVIVKINTKHDFETISEKEKKIVEEIEEIYFHT